MSGTEQVSVESIAAPARGVESIHESAGGIRIFLIADVRGYTAFTQARGDEAAATLAIRFADIVVERVRARDGSVIEVRGDEALAVFGSPRQAIRAAVDLQRRFVDESRSTPDLPIPVGIGIDVGEAVPVGDGYRGGALNLAARLCGEARPGEILASEGVVHLARTLDGISYLERGPMHLKGLADPINVVTISAVGLDAAEAMRDVVPTRERRVSRGQLQFLILGPVAVEAGTTSLPIGGPKQRAVLAHLVIHANELVPTETLIDEIWGEAPPENARNIVQIHISHLRKALGHDRIDGRPPGYRLRLDPSELDAARFDSLLREAKKARPIDPNVAVRTLDDALLLWRGPALADLNDLPSLQTEAARLDERRVEALEERIDGLLAAGSSTRALDDAESLLAKHPWRERVWGQLMLALYREGRQADALNAYQRAREIFADELGIDPSPELARLHERVLRQDASLELRGEPLRGYRLLEKIGDGPTGVVFRAVQPHVGRDVAVKVFNEHIAADPVFVRGFEAEAQRAAALEHPHIVPIYDYWREPGRAYLASRYLRGGSLRALTERGEGLERAHALRVLEQIASALTYAHALGVAHGRVTPANILFDDEGNAYLADFPVGAARNSEPASDVSELGELGRALLGEFAPDGAGQLLEPGGPRRGTPSARAIAEAARAILDPSTSAEPARSELRNPYKGLRAFSEADAGDFFGRSALVGRLLVALTGPDPGSRFLAVVGPSGSGKSSAVRAGVVPAIREGALGDPAERLIAEMYPGVHPLDELEAAIVRVAARQPGSVRERLSGSSRGLLETVELVAPDDAGIVLVVDQFEEVFTMTSDEHERELFLENLRVATADPESRLHVIVTLRADFYDRPLLYQRFGELLAAHTQAIPPLTPDELESAIRGPAEGVGVSAEPGMVAEVITDVAHQPGALPLVQYALTELFERRDDGRLTLDAYREIGGVAGALSARADHLFLEADGGGRRTIRQVFLRLVTLGEGRQDTRRRVTRSELDQLEVEPEQVDAMLHAFGRHRILTFDREPASREPTVEIAHEALLGSWARLYAWIDGARDDLRQELGLRRAAAEWRGSDQDTSFLIRGARLDQLERWAGATSLAIGRPERAYLKASVDQRDREQSEERARSERETRTERRSRARLRALVVLMTTAALVAGSLTIVATSQSQRAGREAGRAEREATISRSRELAAAAIANLEVDPELSVLLAMEAVDVTRSVDGSVLREAEDALHRSVAKSRSVMTLPEIGEVVAWGDGGLIATTNADVRGRIDLRDEHTGDVVRSVDAGASVTDLAFGNGGQTLAATTEDGALWVWDPTDGATLEIVQGQGPASGVSNAAAADRIAAAWRREGVVRVLDGSTGAVIQKLAVTHAAETALRPDGDAVAVSQVHLEERADGGQISVLDVESGELLLDPLVPTTGNALAYNPNAVAWSPDGRSIATASTFLDVWDVATGKSRSSDFAGVNNVAWSPDSTRVVTGARDGSVRIWSQGAFDVAGDITLMATETRGGIAPEGLDFSPEGTRVIAASVDGQVGKIWDVSPTGDAEVGNLETVGYYGSVAFTNGGTRIVAPDRDGRVAWWDPITGRRGPQIGPRIQNEYRFDVSADGRSIAFGRSRTVTAWDVRSGDLLFSHRFPEYVENVDWSPDGRYLAAASYAGVSVLDRTRTLVAEGPGGESARFSPNGTLIATIGERVTLWDWRKEEVVDRFPAKGWDLAFDPAGRSIVTASAARATPPEIWEVASGARRAILRPLAGEVYGIAFSPDGSIVAIGGWDDGTVRTFEARDGEPLLVLEGHPAGVFGLAFSPDGSRLASQSPTLIRVWAVDIDHLLDVARRNVTRSLTDAECRRYLHVPRCSESGSGLGGSA